MPLPATSKPLYDGSRWPNQSWMANLLRCTLMVSAEQILAFHVPETRHGTSSPFLMATEQRGTRFGHISPVQMKNDLIDDIRQYGIDGLFKDLLDDEQETIVLLSGWGSVPDDADMLLSRLYPRIAASERTHLVLLNYAVPLGRMFRNSSQPPAHPEPQGFAEHVAAKIGVDRGMVALIDFT